MARMELLALQEGFRHSLGHTYAEAPLFRRGAVDPDAPAAEAEAHNEYWEREGSSRTAVALQGSYDCRTVCHVVPLQAVSNQDCNWGDRHDPTHSISGMKHGWASLYMDRSNSSLAAPNAAPPGYGTFGYAGLVRLLPGEVSLALSVYVDKSIVEAFAMDGRATLTGRVYPSSASATNVGIYSQGASASAAAWALGPAFN